MSIETMKQVLELIKLSKENYGNDMYLTEAVDELEITIETTQKAEPVTKLSWHPGFGFIMDMTDAGRKLPQGAYDLYTTHHPPPVAEPHKRKPLTDEEIILIVADCASSHQHTDIHFARAIEAAHGIYAPTERKENI